jgi:hypothetical protein
VIGCKPQETDKFFSCFRKRPELNLINALRDPLHSLVACKVLQVCNMGPEELTLLKVQLLLLEATHQVRSKDLVLGMDSEARNGLIQGKNQVRGYVEL